MDTGRSQFLTVEKDTLIIRHAGAFRPADMEEIERRAIEVHARHGCYFLIIDMTHLGLAAPEARHQAMALARTLPAAGVALFGGSPLTRTWTMLVTRGVTLLTKGTIPVAFVKSEKEAQAWIVALRDKLRRPAP